MSAATSQSSSSACDFSCVTIFAPVCASNGETFSSWCELNRTRCVSGDDTLEIAAQGACASGPGSSSGSGSSCLQEFACLDVFTPVCGSDGQTYSNECFLRRASCSDPTLTLSYSGGCSGSNGEGGTDVGDANSTSGGGCVETLCTNEFLPLCGSDGVTYGNECLFQNAQCTKPSLTLASEGECSSAPTSSSGSGLVVGSVSSESASSDSNAASGSRKGYRLTVVAFLAMLAV